MDFSELKSDKQNYARMYFTSSPEKNVIDNNGSPRLTFALMYILFILLTRATNTHMYSIMAVHIIEIGIRRVIFIYFFAKIRFVFFEITERGYSAVCTYSTNYS